MKWNGHSLYTDSISIWLFSLLVELDDVLLAAGFDVLFGFEIINLWKKNLIIIKEKLKFKKFILTFEIYQLGVNYQELNQQDKMAILD